MDCYSFVTLLDRFMNILYGISMYFVQILSYFNNVLVYVRLC